VLKLVDTHIAPPPPDTIKYSIAIDGGTVYSKVEPIYAD
jgi:hypothetical protein